MLHLGEFVLEYEKCKMLVVSQIKDSCFHKKLYSIHLFLFAFFACCAPSSFATSLNWLFQCSNGNQVTFKSNFDSKVSVVGDELFASLDYLEDRRSCSEGWREVIDPSFKFGYARIQYQGGDIEKRWARIVSQSSQEESNALHFGLKTPYADKKNQELKGRVQMVLSNNQGIHNVNVNVGMKLSQDFSVLYSYHSKNRWLTISEWWNNGGWSGDSYPFRITVDLVKPEEGIIATALHFSIRAEVLDTELNKFVKVWHQTNEEFNVPIGRWVELDYNFVEGDAETGRFVMFATPENGKKVTIFSVGNYTHHPDDPSPDGLQDINPIKLYTSGKIIEHFTQNNKVLSVFWDNLNITACKELTKACPVKVESPPASPSRIKFTSI